MPDSQPSTNEIGVVTGLTGQAYAESESGSRALEPGSPIFEGEDLITGPAGNVEVRFIDDTLLSQGANSRITLDDYIYDTSESSASELLLQITEGTFRVVTGKIAEQNPERFKVGSPLATIGIRGTITVHEVIAGGAEKHGVEEIHSGKALIIQSNITGGIRQIAQPQGIVEVFASGALGLVRPLSMQELQEFRGIAPANIRQEQEILNQQDEDEDTPDDDQQDEGEGQDGDALPEDVNPGGGEPEGGEGGLQGANGLLPGQVIEPVVKEPLERGQPHERPELGATPPPQPKGEKQDDPKDDPIDPIDPINDPKPTPITGKDDNSNSNTITGDDNANTLTGTSSADIILGLGADDELYGMDGDDSLYGGTGEDLLNGGEGNDYLSGDAGKDILTGDDGNDILYGGTEDDKLYGEEGADSLYGGTGKDILNGGLGNDYLDGGTSSDDVDFASYSDALASVSVDLSTHTATGADGHDTLVNIEGVIGSSHDDVLTGDDGDNRFEGLLGNDVINGGDGSDWVQYETLSSDYNLTVDLTNTTTFVMTPDESVTYISSLTSIENVLGSANADNITGSNDENILYGNSGDDIIHGLDGDDTIFGQNGNDFLFGENGSNSIDGGSGFDTVSYIHSTTDVIINAVTGSATHGGETDTIAHIESFIGSDKNDNMTGSTGNEHFFGGKGNNVIDGGDGIDTVSFAGSTTGVTFTISSGGEATVTHSDGTDTLSNIEGFTGTADIDNITGSSGDEIFNWSLENDVYNGGGGHDILSYASFYKEMTINMTAEGVGKATEGSPSSFEDTFTNIQHVIGTAQGDTFNGLTCSGSETFQSGKGIDTINLDNLAVSELEYTSIASSGDDNYDQIQNFKSGQDYFKFSGNFDSSAKTSTFATIAGDYSGSDDLFGGDEDAHFVFDTNAQKLWYDSNGDEAGGNTLIADLDTNITIDDIHF
ncbi:FecR family protein [Maridesulfovibrio ferrireducens]|uniref:FecR family protein n=1 Tax=Maridesulfovibrio ferrireducens TaxID=246191 RepID=A0A1G9D6M2_9BACT|nr:FecR domain-containing protein [Maridesulfovibrio ferrireducens]SDK59559.1 FecR family protein [Maridesulfovibrio ferrireducens]